jgi:hypothetical protein
MHDVKGMRVQAMILGRLRAQTLAYNVLMHHRNLQHSSHNVYLKNLLGIDSKVNRSRETSSADKTESMQLLM